MTKNNIKSKKGFTIIEVVLVLAIAGLIFLMVFIALPALQRSQRDTQRKQDLSRVITAVQNYQSNHQGNIPTFNSTFINEYLKVGNDTFQDPSGAAYTFYGNASVSSGVPAYSTTSAVHCGSELSIGAACTNQLTGANQFKSGPILVKTYAKCSGDKAVRASGKNNYAILMKLEGAGIACYSN